MVSHATSQTRSIVNSKSSICLNVSFIFTNWMTEKIHDYKCLVFNKLAKYNYRPLTLIIVMLLLNVMFFTISTSDQQPSVCPNGGTFYRDRCYWMGRRGSVMLHEAEQACQEEYGENVRLAVIKDEDVNVSPFYCACFLRTTATANN